MCRAAASHTHMLGKRPRAADSPALDSVAAGIDELCSRCSRARRWQLAFSRCTHCRCIIASSTRSSSPPPCVHWALLAASSSAAVLLAEGAAGCSLSFSLQPLTALFSRRCFFRSCCFTLHVQGGHRSEHVCTRQQQQQPCAFLQCLGQRRTPDRQLHKPGGCQRPWRCRSPTHHPACAAAVVALVPQRVCGAQLPARSLRPCLGACLFPFCCLSLLPLPLLRDVWRKNAGSMSGLKRVQVRLQSFVRSLLCVQDDEKAAAAVADAAADGIFNAAASSLVLSTHSLSASSSAPEAWLLHPASVSSAHALSLFCILASQVMVPMSHNHQHGATFEVKPPSFSCTWPPLF